MPIAEAETALPALPKPYYEERGIKIYQGDCRAILPHLGRFDLLLTDPPYGMDYQSNWRALKHSPIQGDSALPVDLIGSAIAAVSRAAYVFCRWDNLADMPPPSSVLAWVKNNWTSGDLLHQHGRQWEACCFYALEGHEFTKRIPDVIFCAKEPTTDHPTEKPEDLCRKLIQCNVGDSILDPFMGVGTTLVAAKNLGRRATGIEIEERYCEIAANRLRQEVFDFG